jgi:hypothetical protein
VGLGGPITVICLYRRTFARYAANMPPKHLLLMPLLAAMICAAAPAQPLTGLQRDVTFGDYTPQSDNHELLRRVLAPAAWQYAQAELTKTGQNLQPQSIDLAKEHFIVYVPPLPPPAAGYGLMVFVPPWDSAWMPDGWSAVFDERAMIYVSAAQSGNDQNVFTRRMPLALLAEANIAKRYQIDPSRVYIGGLSGGSRVAMRLALAYPDVFEGAFLNAGSDPIGTKAIPIPPADLLRRFQENTRLYYATGAQDIGSLGLDAHSLASMRDFCVFNVIHQVVPDTTHEIASPHVLAQALAYLDTPPSNDMAQLSSCRNGLH